MKIASLDFNENIFENYYLAYYFKMIIEIDE
jgi:hypothetical protein